jgi:hypothetical protein
LYQVLSLISNDHSAIHDRRGFVSSISFATAALCVAPEQALSEEVAEPFILDPVFQQKRRETSSKVLFTEGMNLKLCL